MKLDGKCICIKFGILQNSVSYFKIPSLHHEKVKRNSARAQILSVAPLYPKCHLLHRESRGNATEDLARLMPAGDEVTTRAETAGVTCKQFRLRNGTGANPAVTPHYQVFGASL